MMVAKVTLTENINKHKLANGVCFKHLALLFKSLCYQKQNSYACYQGISPYSIEVMLDPQHRSLIANLTIKDLKKVNICFELLRYFVFHYNIEVKKNFIRFNGKIYKKNKFSRCNQLIFSTTLNSAFVEYFHTKVDLLSMNRAIYIYMKIMRN